MSFLSCKNEVRATPGEQHTEGPFAYRSLSFHSADPDMDLIRLAKKIGYNDVTLQTEIGTGVRIAKKYYNLGNKYKGHNLPDSLDPQQVIFEHLKRYNDSTGHLDEIKDMGMTISLWTREIEGYDPEWGPLEADNERLWKEIYKRYVNLCDTLLPQVDYIILTLAESSTWISGYDMTMKTCKTIYDACKACDVELIVRTFIYDEKQGKDAYRVFEDLPDDVIVMSKYGPKDWNPFGIMHPYIGTYAPKREIMEDDIGGEYYKINRVARCMTKYLKQRFDSAKNKFDDLNRFWGLNIRVNRGWEPDNYRGSIYNEVQEADLWSYSYWATGKADDIEAPVKAWAAHTFGDSIADEMVDIFLPTGEVIANVLFLQGEPFGDTRNRIPGSRTTGGYGGYKMKPWKEKARRLNDSVILQNNITPYVQGRSNVTNDSSWIPNLKRLNRGDMEIIKEQEKIFSEALELARKSLAKFQEYEKSIPTEKYEYYTFKLKENIYVARYYSEAILAWLKASRRLYSDDPDVKNQMLEEVKTHLRNVHELMKEVNEFEVREFQLGDRTYHFKQANYDYQMFLNNFLYHFDIKFDEVKGEVELRKI